MKKVIVLISVLGFLLSQNSEAQIWRMRRYEGMFGLGTANCYGDIGGFSNGENLLGLKDIRLGQTLPVLYLGARYKIQERLAVKASTSYAMLRGNDEKGSNVNRDFYFKTNLFEFSAQLEYSFLREEPSNSYLMMKGRGITDFVSNFSAYGFAGMGFAMFNPEQTDEMIDRVGDISTSAAMVFPIGLALKYGISPRNSLSLEIGGRLTTSDKIDGYTSEYSKFSDVYYFGVISYIYKIKTSRKGWPVFKE